MPINGTKIDTRYHATLWTDGDKVTADGLNKIELGLVEMYKNQEPLMVVFDKDGHSNIKFEEVSNAYFSGRAVLFDWTDFLNEMVVTCILYVDALNKDINATLPSAAYYASVDNQGYICAMYEK